MFKYHRSDYDIAKEYIDNGKITARIKSTRDINLFKRRYDNASIEDGKLYVDGKQVVYQEDIPETLNELYENPRIGLIGRDKFYNKIRQDMIGISKRDIQSFINNLETNQVHRQPVKKVVPRGIRLQKENSKWYMNLVVINKPEYRIIAVMIDGFSKYLWCHILRDKSFPRVKKFVEWIFDKEKPNLPRIVQTDNAAEFGQKLTKLLESYGVKHTHSRTYRPTDNAIVERANKTIKSIITKWQTQWNIPTIDGKLMADVMYNYNHNVHSTTGISPAELRGNPDMYKKARRNIRRYVDKQVEESIDLHKPLRLGDYVRVKNEILEQIRDNTFKRAYSKNWSYEIFKVVHVSKPNSRRHNPYFELADEDGNNLGRHFYRNELLKIDKDKLIRGLGEDNYVVEAILDMKPKKGRGKKRYLVKWMGYDDKYNSWVDEDDMNAPQLIEDFMNSR